MKNHKGDRVSTNGYRAFLAAGTCLPLLKRSRRSGDQLYCSAVTLGLGFVVTRVVKTLIPARRPDNGAPNSFPSSHSALAVATAVVASEIDPKRAWWWYAGAGLICASRIILNRHRPVDVGAGALLGWALARRTTATEGICARSSQEGSVQSAGRKARQDTSGKQRRAGKSRLPSPA